MNGTNLTVMTFNLRYHEPNDGPNAWPHRIGRAASVIEANGPDVLGVQEGQQPMLHDLQERLTGYDWLGQPRTGGPGGEHCAVFYRKERLEALESGQFWLSETPDAPESVSWDSSLPRICTWVRFHDRRTGGTFTHFNTHLDHRGAEARLHGAVLIFARMTEQRKRYGEPALLTGDMNCTPDSEPIRFWRGEIEVHGAVSDLQDVCEQAGVPAGPTFTGFKETTGGGPIDYIFATPEAKVVRAAVDRTRPGGGWASDHYPVVAELNLSGVPG